MAAIDLEQEVNAAAQVQPQIHRFGAQRAQPVGRRRGQVQRNRVITAELAGQHVARLNLGRCILEPHDQMVFLQFDRGRVDARVLEHAANIEPGNLRDFTGTR